MLDLSVSGCYLCYPWRITKSSGYASLSELADCDTVYSDLNASITAASTQ
jgi:hypothetical protein